MIRWISDQLGTAPAHEVLNVPGLNLIDVRDLVDKDGNSTDAVREKIQLGIESLRCGQRTVICCDYGFSRSNAIAAGVLAVHLQIAFIDAVRLVQQKTGEKEIKLGPLEAVKLALAPSSTNLVEDGNTSILITGASGFLGTSLLKRLGTSVNVIAPSRKELDILNDSTEFSMLVAEHKVNTIIHLASPRVYTSNLALGQTLSMMRNVLDVCATHGARLIYLSGWEIFSGYAGNLLVDEAVAPMPRGPYGEAKYLAEELIGTFQRRHQLNVAVIRSSPVYGLQSDRPKFIHNFIDKLRRNEPVVTHAYKNGDAALDLLHIDDLIEGVMSVLNRDFSGIIHLGTGIVTSTFDVADFLRQELGSSSELRRSPISTTVARIAMNCETAHRVLDWRTNVSLPAGLRQFIASRP